MALCKVMIIGNLGADPEMRYTPSGRPVTQFNVAVNQSTKNQQTNEWVEATDWFRVSVWGDRAERAAENLRKGNKVFVEGRFKTREFEGRDGQKRTSLELTADSLVNLEKRPREEGDGDFASAGPTSATRPAAATAGAPAGGAPAAGGGAPASAPRGGGGGYDDTSDLDDLPF
jgi:single-strand DNA-binding protein